MMLPKVVVLTNGRPISHTYNKSTFSAPEGRKLMRVFHWIPWSGRWAVPHDNQNTPGGSRGDSH